MFPYSLVIFDLDGTLVDSAPNIAEALNGTLQELGLQQFSEARIRSWIGEGVHVLLSTALREVGSTRDVDAAMPVMMRHYEASLLHNPPLYPGVAEALAGLRDAGATLALCTNKPSRFIAPLLDHLGIAAHFSSVLGGDSLPQRKPDPAPLLQLARHFQRSPQHCLMVGDSATDAAAANAANMPLAMVRYGYLRGFDVQTSGAVAIIDDMRELLALK
ncbi:phosphoglycolate phosphatase [Xanthomonas oryzae pv. oryzicola]|uniref:phosphoglycolate phosphatase n=1 Tax=Xanthomonas oryzae TaxID=347 RepID=UPI000643B710|nr:phosphoglycolate phosphatase [Xanthomonas oryzae]AKK65293.1 phosphoglycolate phosphatase [Xanthomonas oryzae pv. oryzicola]AKN99714.1 phosphoglycolate phosphatase [Xanthomonas oryzae pv. oryzicola]KOR51937.1 phosphoglycolate phosphatase [Xanthomonas oryzae]OLK91298.1 phosphoglycolate phosphatase [Xanthomonas oryzae pv. oryzicola]ULX25132.1 phosphoglycolate phosphatase [Xanthomonas oryzae pv. oryzicola]